MDRSRSRRWRPPRSKTPEPASRGLRPAPRSSNPAPMKDVDVGSIVPSTRDLFQVIATRRKSLAAIGLLGADRPAEEAARLYELNVSAFAFAEPGEAMQLAARATKTVPSLCLFPATDRQHLLAARYFGADGACIDAALPADDWDKLAKIA